MARNILICHVMNELPTGLKEIGQVKTKTQSQEFTWQKRIYPIPKDALDVIWEDRKGISHLHVFVNESDGTYYWLTPEKLNLYGFITEREIIVEEKQEDGSIVKVKKKLQLPNSIASPLDLCTKCGSRITIDAMNVRDLVKRKTVNAIWGIDNSFMMLLLIMGIVLVILMGAMFYIIGQWQATQQTLNTYLKPAMLYYYGIGDFNFV